MMEKKINIEYHLKIKFLISSESEVWGHEGSMNGLTGEIHMNYMVWPSKSFDLSKRKPVGDFWTDVWDSTPSSKHQ